MDTRYTILRRVYSGMLLVIWIIAPYALLQQFSIRDVYWMQPSALDEVIPVNLDSVWIYLSLYPLLAWTGLGVERSIYLRYMFTVGWVTLVAHMVFFFFPTGVARDVITVSEQPAIYEWLVSLDQPRNAFPSLHAAFSFIAGLALSTSRWYNVYVKAFAWLWVIAIFWSTIALRQHYVADLVAGATISLVVWMIMGREKCREKLCGGF